MAPQTWTIRTGSRDRPVGRTGTRQTLVGYGRLAGDHRRHAVVRVAPQVDCRRAQLRILPHGRRCTEDGRRRVAAFARLWPPGLEPDPLDPFGRVERLDDPPGVEAAWLAPLYQDRTDVTP